VNIDMRKQLRSGVVELLARCGDRKPLADDDTLFTSGRLDSLSMTMLIVKLEKDFGVDFAKVDFSVDAIDTLNDIGALVDGQVAA